MPGKSSSNYLASLSGTVVFQQHTILKSLFSLQYNPKFQIRTCASISFRISFRSKWLMIKIDAEAAQTGHYKDERDIMMDGSKPWKWPSAMIGGLFWHPKMCFSARKWQELVSWTTNDKSQAITITTNRHFPVLF